MTTQANPEIAGESTIAFSPARWRQVQETHRLWFARKLGRPQIQLRLHGAPSRLVPAEHPFEGFTAAYGDIPEDKIIESWDYQLSTQRFLGDSFPTQWLNYGPGVLAAFLGCELFLGKKKETIWFHPQQQLELPELEFVADGESNPYWQKMSRIIEAAGRRWRGQMQIGFTDFGGTLDVLSSFRPSEALLYDLYDEPERVIELTWEIHRRWWEFYDRQEAKLRASGNPGTSCWTPLLCRERFYMLQCDFGYMLGPNMFDRFVIPELAASCRRLDQAFYHLDGVGQLPSLDLLLAIPELKGVQWIPGAGQPGVSHWPEVHRRISDAGKLIQFWGEGKEGMQTLETLAQQIGRADNIAAILTAPYEMQAEAEEFLARWGA